MFLLVVGDDDVCHEGAGVGEGIPSLGQLRDVEDADEESKVLGI